MEPEYIVIARKMMGYDDLPQGLINALGEVNEFVRLAGGELRSRQTIAVIVANWVEGIEAEATEGGGADGDGVIRQGNCPKCGGLVHYDGQGDVVYDAEGTNWPCTCPKCGFEGYEVCDTTFVGFTDKNDPERNLIS